MKAEKKDEPFCQMADMFAALVSAEGKPVGVNESREALVRLYDSISDAAVRRRQKYWRVGSRRRYLEEGEEPKASTPEEARMLDDVAREYVSFLTMIWLYCEGSKARLRGEDSWERDRIYRMAERAKDELSS